MMMMKASVTSFSRDASRFSVYLDFHFNKSTELCVVFGKNEVQLYIHFLFFLQQFSCLACIYKFK